MEDSREYSLKTNNQNHPRVGPLQLWHSEMLTWKNIQLKLLAWLGSSLAIPFYEITVSLKCKTSLCVELWFILKMKLIFKSLQWLSPQNLFSKKKKKMGLFDPITPLTMLTSMVREYRNEKKIFWTATKSLPHIVEGHRALLLGNVTILVKINVAGHEKDNHGWYPPIFMPLKQWSSRKWIGVVLRLSPCFLTRDWSLILGPKLTPDTAQSPAPN